MKWHFVKKLSHATEAIVVDELNDTYRVARVLRDGEERKLAELRQSCVECREDECTCREPDKKRNFIAHAGLLECCVTVRRDGDDFIIDAKSTHRCLLAL